MSTLNNSAANVARKYIRTTSPENVVDTRKKRGLQAEINKLAAIKKVVLTNNIEDKELLRIRAEINSLLYAVDAKVTAID